MGIKEARQEVYYWQLGKGTGDNFSCLLFRLMGKADSSNRLRLALGFPEEHQAYREWWDSLDTKALFAKWGFKDAS